MKQKNKYTLSRVFEGLLLAVLIGLILLTGLMIRHVQQQMENNAVDAVKNIFQKSENLIDSDILADLNSVKRFAAYISWDDPEKATVTMQAFLQEYDYRFAIYLNAEGIGYDSQGQTMTADQLPVPPRAPLSGSTAYSAMFVDETGMSLTVIEMPLEKDNQNLGAFYVGVPMERYSSNAIAKSFRSDGYYFLVDTLSGSAVSAAIQSGENETQIIQFADLIEAAGYRGDDQQKLKNRLVNQEEFSIRCKIQGKEYYLYFIPVQENPQWILCGIIPSEVIQAESQSVLAIITGIIEMLIVISVLTVTVVLYFLVRRRNNERRQLVEREIQNATYDALSEKSDLVVCLFDQNQHRLEQVFRSSKRILGHDSQAYLTNPELLEELCSKASPDLYHRLMAETIEKDESYQLQIEHAQTHQLLDLRFTIKTGIMIAGRKKMMFYWEDITQNMRVQESLRTAAQAAQQANRAKSEFLSNMSHEIRTPMNAIIGMVEILDRSAQDPVHVHESVRKLRLSAAHLLSIINDILDLSRIESGKVSIKEEPFCLSELIDNVSGIIRTQADAKHRTFDIHIHDLWNDHLCGDWTRLNQVLINILNNAVKYTRPFGQINFEIMESPSQREGYVSLCFQVRDNGIGMSKEFMQRLGSPFEQEQGELHIQEGGTGLGLSIVYNIVEMMGGTLSVESELEKGSAFAIRLDLKKADYPEFRPQEIAGMRVIIIDDDPQVCEDVTAILEAAAVFADSALDAPEALRKIQSAHQNQADYDVAIVDWVLPGMDGLTLTQTIHEQISEELPVIFVSAYDWSQIMDKAQEAGIEHFIEKPLFRKRLYSALSEIRSGRIGKPQTADPLSVPELSSCRVLLVEDNELNREIAVEYLKIGLIEAQIAVNGQEALDQFLAAPAGTFDAILMDLQMPVMDGLTACRKIRQSEHPQAQTIPIIAMTANAFEEDVQRCLRAGMNAHMAKPLDCARLLRILEQCVRKKEEE